MAVTGAIMMGVGALGSAAAGIMSANTQAGMAASAEQMSATTFGEQQGYASQLAQLISNPSSITQNPAYQFTYSQGLDALTRQMAAKGYLGSGNMGTALVQYGQGLATSQLSQQEQLLASLSGLQAASSPAQSLSVASSAQNASFNQLGSSLASLGYTLGGGYSSFGTPGSTPQGGWDPYGLSGMSPGVLSSFGGDVINQGGYQVNVPGGPT